MQAMKFGYKFDGAKLDELEVTDNCSYHILRAEANGQSDLYANLSVLMVCGPLVEVVLFVLSRNWVYTVRLVCCHCAQVSPLQNKHTLLRRLLRKTGPHQV